MRLALIVSTFPELSEKFIINQATGLLDAGVELDIYAAMEGTGDKRHSLAERYGLGDRAIYARVPESIKKRLKDLPSLLAAGLAQSPRSALRSLRFGTYSTAARSLKTLYFLKAFAGRRYDLVHCHFGPNGLVGAFLKDCGLANRLVVTFHGSDINSYPRRYGERVYRTLYDRADAVTAGTNFTRAKLEANGCPPAKLEVLPAGIRMEEYPPSTAGSRMPMSILTVGRVVELKGYRYAVEALALLRPRFPEAEYFIVGEGSGRAYLERRAAELGIGGALHFLGALSDVEVADLYRRVAVFVLPSIRAPDGAEEGQGLVLQEAQACGIPVVSTLIGGIAEGVLEGVTGFLVPEKDPAALADRIGRLLGDPALRERMGAAGRAFVQGTYDIPVLTKRLIEIYNRT